MSANYTSSKPSYALVKIDGVPFFAERFSVDTQNNIQTASRSLAGNPSYQTSGTDYTGTVSLPGPYISEELRALLGTHQEMPDTHDIDVARTVTGDDRYIFGNVLVEPDSLVPRTCDESAKQIDFRAETMKVTDA